MAKKKKDPAKVKQGRKSRERGKRGEREAALLLRERGYSARRGVQYKGGPDSPDVQCVELEGKVHIEVKRVEKLNVYTAMSQSKLESREGEVPIVLHRKDNQEWLVTLSGKDYLDMLEKIHPPEFLDLLD